MADDHSQRSFRASEPPVRGQAKTSNSDPLAELARLIGQTDPFGEYGRERAGRAASPPPTDSDWNSQPARSPYAAQRSFDPHHRPAPIDQQMAELEREVDRHYGRHGYSDTPVASTDDPYQTQHEARGYSSEQGDYQQEAYEQDPAQYTDEEFYEDSRPPRRRLAIMAIVGVCGLAVIGTAGAFGYRALFGSSASTQPPPVIKADAGPSKIVPATASKDTQSSKLITDRVNERGQSEKLVSREEQPIDRPAAVVLSQAAAPQPALGSGVVGSEPKKVRTIAIRPDQPVVADAMSQSAPLAAAVATRPQAPAPRPAAPTARPAVPPPAADNATAEAEPDSSPPPRSSVRQVAPAPGNAPLSLNPDTSPARAQARPAPAPTQTAAVAPQAAAPAPSSASSPGSGSFVQLSSQRSEGEAQTAFRSLQAQYPTQLGSRDAVIHKVDLGAKGTYYRAMVGPFANGNEAGELCASLKAAGAQCLIQRN
jgi:hypothetical protein